MRIAMFNEPFDVTNTEDLDSEDRFLAILSLTIRPSRMLVPLLAIACSCFCALHTHTHTQKKKEAVAGGDAPPPAAKGAEVLKLRPTEPEGKKLRRLSFAEGVYERCEDARRDACSEAKVEFIPEGWAPARINRQLGSLAKASPAEQQRFEDGFDAYLADATNAARDPPFSLSFFIASRSTWESRAKRTGGAP